MNIGRHHKFLCVGVTAFFVVLSAFHGPLAPRRANAQAQTFVPPPRTIADITAILDQQKPDPQKAAANRSIADQAPPADAKPADLAQFYYRRGTAARELGRVQQSVSDFREAVRNARAAQLGRSEFSRCLGELADAEMVIGNLRNALSAITEWRANIDPRFQGEVLVSLNLMARAQARAGEVEAAEQVLANAKAYLQSLAAGAQYGNSGSGLSPRGYSIYAEVWAGSVARSEAMVLSARGKYMEAEASIRLAVKNYDIGISKVDQMRGSTNDAFIEITLRNSRVETSQLLAEILRKQGRTVEAEVEARRALLDTLQTHGRESLLSGDAVRILASIIADEGRPLEAKRLALAALAIYQAAGAEGTSPSMVETLRLVAQSQAAVGDWQAALETYEKLLQGLGTDQDALGRYMESDPFYGVTLVLNGRAPAALAILERASARAFRVFGERSYDTAEARGFYGLALAASGQRDRALQEFRAAAPVLLQGSRQSEDDRTNVIARDQRLQLILESYMGLLAQTTAGDAAAEALRLAEVARARSVQRAVGASAARAAAANPQLADLARREQDAEKQIAALQGLLTNLLSTPTDQQDLKAVQGLRAQIDDLRATRAKLAEELEKRFPDYAGLINPQPPTVEQVRASLKPGEALIATYVGAQRSFVWAVSKDGPLAFAQVALNDREVSKLVRDLRRSLDSNAGTLGEIPGFDVALANRLYATLLAPVVPGWQNANNLLIVPHRMLGELPFGLLVTEPGKVPPPGAGEPLFANYKRVPFLIRRAAITQLPSVTSLVTLRRLPAGDPKRRAFVGFGDPWFNAREAAEGRASEAPPTRVAQSGFQSRGIRLVRRAAPATSAMNSVDLGQLPRLTDTADEVRSIAMALNADLAADVFLGDRANEQQVLTMTLSDRKVVLFATHGLVPGDLNGLTQPALALTAPSVANVGGDGLLTVDKILGLHLNADWVVLSACNTASGEGAGAEAVSGLGRAFFYAGTRALLVSNWPVETVSARTLTTDLFRRQAAEPGLGRAEALRRAMLALIDGEGRVENGKTLFSYAHPLFWAPFSVVGDGGS